MTGVKGLVLRGRALSQRRRVGVAILFVCRGSVYDVYDTHGSLRDLFLCLMLGTGGGRASEDTTPTLHGCKYICMTYGHDFLAIRDHNLSPIWQKSESIVQHPGTVKMHVDVVQTERQCMMVVCV